jgi:hypothetical protein
MDVRRRGLSFGCQSESADNGRWAARDADAWTTAAPSGIPFDDRWPTPQALDEAAGLARIRDAPANAARRGERLGFDLVELLAAHCFLLHSFLSPIANRRIDPYGGSLANRMRYPLECDWVDGGITTDEASAAPGLERSASRLPKFQRRGRLIAGFLDALQLSQ